MTQRQCRRCHCPFDGDEADVFFRSNPDSRRGQTHMAAHATCIGCELTARTETKVQNRWRAKARSARDRHADRFIREGKASTREDFAQRYGWDVDQMAHDAEHSYGNGCPYCHQTFKEMGNGLSDITLDVVDPEAAPYYQTNVRWACSTCNKQKQRTPPHLWGAKLAAWRKWRKWTLSEYPPDSLFGDWAA